MLQLEYLNCIFKLIEAILHYVEFEIIFDCLGLGNTVMDQKILFSISKLRCRAFKSPFIGQSMDMSAGL